MVAATTAAERALDIDHQSVIRHRYKNAQLLFVGINPHHGSYARGVPFSNNKTFWYLLAEAGLLREKRDSLRDDAYLRKIYKEKFNTVYRLGFINLIDRPTTYVSELQKGEEVHGRVRLIKVIKDTNPKVVCFVGKVSYQKYSGLKSCNFGWTGDILRSQAFVMHFPLHGKAAIRIRELRALAKVAGLQ